MIFLQSLARPGLGSFAFRGPVVSLGSCGWWVSSAVLGSTWWKLMKQPLDMRGFSGLVMVNSPEDHEVLLVSSLFQSVSLEKYAYLKSFAHAKRWFMGTGGMSGQSCALIPGRWYDMSSLAAQKIAFGHLLQEKHRFLEQDKTNKIG